MNIVKKSAVVDYSCSQMYNLVNDIRNYPEFLPMCYDIEIFSETNESIQASLKIKSGFVKMDFTTTNTMQKDSKIDIDLKNGPFKSLKGQWNFVAIDENSCTVSLDMEFAFENKFVEMALGSVFKSLANKMLDAFCTRAKQVYN